MVKLTAKKKDEIAYRQNLVAGYRITGMTQLQIKLMLEKKGIIVNRSTISNDLKALRLGWKEDAKAKTEDLHAEALMKLSQLELEAWSLFNAAKKEGKAGGNTAGFWHGAIRNTLEQKSKLMGLNAPTKVEVDAKVKRSNDLSTYSDEELILIINGNRT